MTTNTQITPAKSAYFLKPHTSHNASILLEMFWKFYPNQSVSNGVTTVDRTTLDQNDV